MRDRASNGGTARQFPMLRQMRDAVRADETREVLERAFAMRDIGCPSCRVPRNRGYVYPVSRYG